MRSDTNLNKRFAKEGVDVSQYANMPGVLDTSKKVDGKPVIRSHSFSGNESNSVFLNHGGTEFENISGVTGLDSPADGRAFAFFDFDRDGRSDIVLTNTNNPQLQLFRNEIKSAGKSIKVRLIGGNRLERPDEVWSSRDAYGAHVLVEAGGKTLRRELRGGDGFAAQNSDTLLIGIGEVSEADKVTVLWPSGKESEVSSVKAGSLLIVHENAKESGPKVVMPTPISLPTARTMLPPSGQLDFGLKKKISVVVTMTTWCSVCRGEIDHLRRLSEMVGEEIGFYAFPVDPDDNEAKLSEFQKEAKPPYEILPSSERAAVESLLKKHFGEMPLPSTFILDNRGRVLEALKGTPTLSQLRLLNQ